MNQREFGCWEMFARHLGDKAQRITSEELVKRLAAMEESPWGPRFGRDFDPRALARLLKPFGIRPTTIRTIGILKIAGNTQTPNTAKGYYRSQFEDAWRRYLAPPLGTAVTSVTTVTAAPPKG